MNQNEFWSKVKKTDKCWLWMGHIKSNGYGQIGKALKQRKVHRISYELIKGPIPKGMTLDHLCKIRHCVNPNHLEIVTSSENVKRGDSPSGINSRINVCKAGHDISETRKCKICERNYHKLYKRKKMKSKKFRDDRNLKRRLSYVPKIKKINERCKNGHPYFGHNLIQYKNKRRCRICYNFYMREFRRI